VRASRVATTGALGTKRGRGRGTFIDSVLTTVDGFYADVHGSLRTWSAAPPKLRPAHAEPPGVDESVPVALTSTDYSSQDGIEPSGADREDPVVRTVDTTGEQAEQEVVTNPGSQLEAASYHRQ
jgi:hypothetical protein